MKQWVVLALMVLAAAFSRLIPHPWNFTAVGAMALFAGAYFSAKKHSLIVPLAALFLSDLFLGFHATLVFVYLAFSLVVTLGWSLREQTSPARIAAFSVLTSALFFVVSNFGVWITGGMYAFSLQGLAECFVAAIPFFGNQIYGDLFFSAILFGSYETLKNIVPELVPSKQV
ncbi:MAG: hypothetical protein HUU57_03630 [Bdellovibrio sp.]|nr:hypothetical protein [Bdellovibrio sp.]